MKIGIVSTFNVECGISTYSEHLTQHYPQGETVIFGNRLGVLSDTRSSLLHPINRCWSRTEEHDQLFEEIIKSGVDVVHFQHEFGLFQNQKSFVQLLSRLKAKKIKTVVTLHTVFRERHENQHIFDCAPFLNRIVVHNKKAIEPLGLVDKTTVIPHGSVLVLPKSRFEARKYLNITEDRIVLLALGFITVTKAAIDIVSAVVRLREEYPNILLMIVGFPMCHGRSYGNLEYCLSLFKRIDAMNVWDNVRVVLKFVPEPEIDYYAGATDIAVENYHQTHHSTSGMSHLVMSYGLPSVSSDANILSDLGEGRSLKYKINDIAGMASNIKQLIRDEECRKRVSSNALSYARETAWDVIAHKHLSMYRGIG
jgi:polysaccharide biosynthesis protein PslF